jgi:YD repeat-containing protein
MSLSKSHVLFAVDPALAVIDCSPSRILRALVIAIVVTSVNVADAQTPALPYTCGCDGTLSTSSCGVAHPTFSAAAAALTTAVSADGIAPCKKHRAAGSQGQSSASYVPFHASLEAPTSYFYPLSPPGDTPLRACQNFLAQYPQFVFESLIRYDQPPFVNQHACRSWYPAEQRWLVHILQWTCASPSAVFWGGWAASMGGVTVPPGVYCLAGARAGVFINNAASIERPQQCPLPGNPIQVNSEEKIDRAVDYAGTTLRFERFYGSQKIARRGGAFIHSFADALEKDGLAVGHRRSDGTIVRFNLSSFGLPPVYPASADLRTTVAIDASGTAPGATRYKIDSLSEPRIDTFDSFGLNLKRLYADGRSITFTHIDALGARVPATAPTCNVLVGGLPVPNQTVPSTLQCVTDDFGRQINFRYAVVHTDGYPVQVNLIQVIDPAGNVIQYAYDEATSVPGPIGTAPSNNLTSVTYPDGYRRLFHYNEPANASGTPQRNALTGITEVVPTSAPVRLSTYKYDAVGRAIYTERAGGIDAYSINYSIPRREVAITDARGTQRTYSFNTVVGVERPLGSTQPAGSGSTACSDSLTYDANGNVASRVDFNGNKTCYVYDLTRNLETKRVEGLAASVDCSTALSSPPAGARIITTQWHPDWRLQTRIAEPKRITTTLYNGQGAVCAPSAALVDGRPLAVVCSTSEQATTDETGAAGFSATTTGAPRVSSYTHTTYGRMLTATDGNGKTTTYAYHADNHPDLGKRGNVATITNAANHVTHYTDYNLHGQPTRVVDANGVVTSNVYDSRLRLRSRTVGSEVSLFDYHPAGHLTKSTLPDGATLTYGHDLAHRLTAIQDQKGNRIEYTLDAMGNRIKEQTKDPSGVLKGNIARVIDALNRVRQVTGSGQQQ